MAGTLPNAVTCCNPCDDPVTVQVPGPAGDPGATGDDGAAGQPAYTAFTVDFTMPNELATGVATVASTAWMAVGMIIFAGKTDGSVIGHLQVTAIGGATSVTLKNLAEIAVDAYLENSIPGSVFTTGSKVCSAGPQGAPGPSVSGQAAGGDLKGTYLNPRLSVANAKGSLPVGDGTNTTAVVAGTDGQLPVYDAAAANGLTPKSLLPNAGTDNALLRLDGATGKPIPGQACAMVSTDNGALQVTYGNAKGTDAVDLQASHSAVTQVASGQEATISGGRRNTANATRSTVAGGDTNTASAQEATVGGGSANQATAARATVGGGDTNVASGQESTIPGGNLNTAAGEQSAIGGGDSNSINSSGTESVIGGGKSNSITAAQSVIAGGEQNLASAGFAAVGGGTFNQATGIGATVPGGIGGLADKVGQLAHSAGSFAAIGDAQTSELMWRIATSDATANVEMFHDAISARATIATGKSWLFEVLLVGRSSAGVTAAWRVTGAIQNNGGTVSLVAAVANAMLADGTGGTWGVTANFVVDADNTNKALRMRVTGAAATAIRWVAWARVVEVSN